MLRGGAWPRLQGSGAPKAGSTVDSGSRTAVRSVDVPEPPVRRSQAPPTPPPSARSFAPPRPR